MKIAAVIGVKDEAGLIGTAARSLLGAGIASVDILDDGSTDGTLEAAAALAAEDPRIRLIRELPSYEGLLMMDGPLFAPILAREAPDRVLFLDADEALVCRGPLARSAFLAAHDLVRLPRYNAAPGPEGLAPPDGGLRQLDLVARRRPLTAGALDSDAALRWVEHLLPPKVIADPAAVSGLSMGGHRGVARPGRALREGTAPDALIVHLPFTSLPRFARKIANAEALLAQAGPGVPSHAAWHWRRWIALKHEGRLEEEFARQCYDAPARAEARATGAFATPDALLGVA
ncbi:hypothetical protein [Pseudoroseicyclus sp. CXY001]|uniref:hypothetical protein n=1 Tax=Pseudoroseicyclus sp. CXY001 TaxID=3242492 RepID=UPI0035709679